MPGAFKRQRTTYRYEFDALGNWIKREVSVNDVKSPEDTVLRTIEYHPH